MKYHVSGYRRLFFHFLTLNIFLTVVLSMTGTSANATSVALPDEQRLRVRLSEFHNALGNSEVVTWYNMTTPGIRSQMNLEQFKKDLRWDDRKHEKSDISGELAKPCSCVNMGFTRCVIMVDITLVSPGKAPSKEKSLQTWEYDGGEWYWGYMGPGNNGRCPGER
ncbi:MAG TPA: hypothetical protein PKM26_03940 [Syntrophorhabdaceae bacterium]|nr:hypothetical protein [Syntrophorhabdaceae bacterium]